MRRGRKGTSSVPVIPSHDRFDQDQFDAGSSSGGSPERTTALRARTRPVVSLRSISKAYPGVQALSSVDLEIFASEVHALCGENGAGKSTLSKVVAGLVQPDSGEVYVDGERVE